MPVAPTPFLPFVAALPGATPPAEDAQPEAFLAALANAGAASGTGGVDAPAAGSTPSLASLLPTPSPVPSVVAQDSVVPPAGLASLAEAPGSQAMPDPAALPGMTPALLDAGPVGEAETAIAPPAAPASRAPSPILPRAPETQPASISSGAMADDLAAEGQPEPDALLSAPMPAAPATAEPLVLAETPVADDRAALAPNPAADVAAPLADRAKALVAVPVAAGSAVIMPVPDAMQDMSRPATQDAAPTGMAGTAEAAAPPVRRKTASPQSDASSAGTLGQSQPAAMPPGIASAIAPAGGNVPAPASAPVTGADGRGAAAPASPVATHGNASADANRTDGARLDGAGGDGAAPVLAPEARVPASLFTQTLDATGSRHAALPYDTAQPTGAAAAAATGTATVSMREGHFGADVGVAIARVLGSGTDSVRDALLIRLDPQHMGRIDVRMTFEDDGTLRAVVSADQPAALDMLRRESTHLDRALSDAGVRADAQSLRFDGTGAGTGNGNQQRQGARPQMPIPQGGSGEFSGAPDTVQPILRSLRGSGHVDLMA